MQLLSTMTNFFTLTCKVDCVITNFFTSPHPQNTCEGDGWHHHQNELECITHKSKIYHEGHADKRLLTKTEVIETPEEAPRRSRITSDIKGSLFNHKTYLTGVPCKVTGVKMKNTSDLCPHRKETHFLFSQINLHLYLQGTDGSHRYG